MNQSSLFPIRTVSDLTGVNAITLRAWERRYGLLEPVRKESGHRLYTQEHIDLINTVVGLLDRGMRIGQVKAHLGATEDQSETITAGGDEGFWSKSVKRMVAAVIRFDEGLLEEAYGGALSLYPVDMVTEQLLFPLLKELGRRWEFGDGTVAEEHFFACYIRNKLGARFHHRIRNRSGKKLLLACLPGDRHETGLLLFGLAANDAGFQTIMLGADMPLEELPAAVEKTGSVAVVLSGIVSAGRSSIKKQLSELVLALNVPVFVGGQISIIEYDALNKAGVNTLGTDMKKGLKTLETALAGKD